MVNFAGQDPMLCGGKQGISIEDAMLFEMLIPSRPIRRGPGLVHISPLLTCRRALYQCRARMPGRAWTLPRHDPTLLSEPEPPAHYTLSHTTPRSPPSADPGRSTGARGPGPGARGRGPRTRGKLDAPGVHPHPPHRRRQKQALRQLRPISHSTPRDPARTSG